MIETHRRRHLAYLMADQGALVGNPEAAPNLPKQHLSRFGEAIRNFFIRIFKFTFGCVYVARPSD